MKGLFRYGKYLLLLVAFGFAAFLALKFRGNGLWEGLRHANAAGPKDRSNYDLTQVKVVNDTLKLIRDRYVDQSRVRPKEMLLSALNFVQRDVAQVIVLHEDGAPTVKVRVDAQEREFKIDSVIGPWDVSQKLREIFAFVQEGLKGTEVDLREVEYAACNGMLHTLDPHSVLLSPEAYKDMNATTTGQFGGLGIVISIRDQQLTVMNPMPNTPASRAGVKRFDRIVKIGNESTLNMGLNEAVNHLRGQPGSKVTVWLHRDGPDGWNGERPFELQRELIKVKSVESKLLEGGIGYVRLKQFQSNTANELDQALAAMKSNGELKGLVLDLRGNPGGLLEQSARVVDKFVLSGPIVATVGNASEGREEKVAKVEGTEPNYPMVVLVSGTSASASEIVAGALKNHDRALIVGESTFGKGSVQLVFNELPDKAALKLTIAQYLTEPGDISIQGTGVTPDIELDPMTADLLEMDLSVDGGGTKERDLSRSLSNARAREGQKPSETVRYNFPQKERQELRDRGGELDDNIAIDFPIRFARDLASRIPQGKRPDQLKAAKQVIADVRTAELTKATQDLAALGIDWSPDPATTKPAPPNLDIKVETDRPQNEVTSGESINLKLSVTNKGTAPIYRLSAVSKSDNPLFDNKELVIGKLEPGKTRTAIAPLGWCDIEGRKVGSTEKLPKDAPRVCRIPKEALTRSDWITLNFDTPDIKPVRTQVSLRAIERPVFAYGYQIVDNRKGNGDGRVQKGESFTMYLTVKNVGKGKSFETQANVRNLSGDGLLLRAGRFDISNMTPGETRKVAFTFDVENQLTDNEAKVELSITDRDLRENIVEKVRMPIALATDLAPGQGTMKAKGTGANLFEAPDAGSRFFGRLGGGTSVQVLAAGGEFVKVSLGESRFAFVKKGELDLGGTPATQVPYEDVLAHMPPTIELAQPVLATKDATIKVTGSATDTTKLMDGYIFVGGKKVFYRSNKNGADQKRMPFEAQLPLRPGVNVISVIARESPETLGRRVFIVRRDSPSGDPLPTPKNDDELTNSSSMDD
ncbi:MAG: MXAN_5808 family serine peptidase [Polyangiaceae bacterium]